MKEVINRAYCALGFVTRFVPIVARLSEQGGGQAVTHLRVLCRRSLFEPLESGDTESGPPFYFVRNATTF